MRDKLILILVLILTMLLMGCSGEGTITPATDETKVKSVIQDYASVLNNQNWNEAKSYCVYNSFAYQKNRDTYLFIELPVFRRILKGLRGFYHKII